MASNSLGNPIDTPERSLEALRSSDLLIFEEDRPARLALKTAGIHKEYVKFTEHREEATLDLLKECLRAGKTACYMSDQGVPTLADPGRELLKLAYSLHAKVQVIPGPSSITATLAACPFLGNSFIYHGFLPREEELRIASLRKYLEETQPVVFLETPYRRKNLISSLEKVFGPKRNAIIALDISGPDEEFIFEKLAKLKDLDRPKLNFVIIIEGVSPPQSKPNRRRKR